MIINGNYFKNILVWVMDLDLIFCSTNVKKQNYILHNKRLLKLHKKKFHRNVQAIYHFLSTIDFCDENADRRTYMQGWATACKFFFLTFLHINVRRKQHLYRFVWKSFGK